MIDLLPVLSRWASVLGDSAQFEPLNDKERVWLVTGADGERYVLKSSAGTAFSEHTADRLALVVYLAEQGVPVAAPVAPDGQPGIYLAEVGGSSYWLSPYLFSEADERPLDWQVFYANTGAAIASLHRALARYRGPVHSWRLDLVADTLRTDLPRLREYLSTDEQAGDQRAAFERAAGYLAQRLPGRLAGLPAQTIHGDCHGGNIVWAGEQVAGFIDLDHLPWGPRVYDLGYFLADMAKNRIRQPDEIATWFSGLGPFVRGYQSVLELDEAEITILPAVMAAVQARFAAWFVKMGEGERVRFNLEAMYWLADQAGHILRAMGG